MTSRRRESRETESQKLSRKEIRRRAIAWVLAILMLASTLGVFVYYIVGAT